MKVLLVGEGPSELGGALQTLVRRLGLSEDEIDQDRVQRPDLHTHHGKGQGYFKRAVRWMWEAKKRGYDAVVLVIDQDKLPQRTKELSQAQQYSGISIRRAFGVAIRTFDAWMLADEQALTTVLGCKVSRQREPEHLAEPKRICGELLDSSNAQFKPTEMYAAIARIADLEILRDRCRNGFAPFAERVQAL